MLGGLPFRSVDLTCPVMSWHGMFCSIHGSLDFGLTHTLTLELTLELTSPLSRSAPIPPSQHQRLPLATAIVAMCEKLPRDAWVMVIKRLISPSDDALLACIESKLPGGAEAAGVTFGAGGVTSGGIVDVDVVVYEALLEVMLTTYATYVTCVTCVLPLQLTFTLLNSKLTVSIVFTLTHSFTF